MIHIIALTSLCYLAFNYKYLIEYNIIKKTKTLLISMAVILIYLIAISLIKRKIIFYTPLFWLFDVIPFAFAMVIYFKKNDYSFIKLINLVIAAGFLQAATAIVAFAFRNIQSIFVENMINHGYSDIIREISEYRIFGYSGSLTFATPILQSIIAIITLYMAIKYKLYYILISVPLIFSAIINARTSIIILIIGILLLVFFSIIHFNAKNFLKLILLLMLIAVLVAATIIILKKYSIPTYTWFIHGINEFLTIFNNNETGYFSYLFNKDIYVFPHGISLFFGEGITIISENIFNIQSDIGYINDIWVGGLLYSAMLYTTIGYLIIKLYKTKNYFVKFMSVFFMVSFLLLNIKGQILTSDDVSNFFIMFYVCSICLAGNTKRIEKWN
jgi:hypothetical protein